MRERELKGMGTLLLAFVVAALVSGIGWRFDTLAGGDPAGASAADRGGAGASASGVPVRHLEIPVGARAEQIAGVLESTRLGDGRRFMQLVRSPGWAELRGAKWAGARTLEGYLHPGVYDVREGFSEETLLRAMLERFDAAFTGAMVRRADALGFTVNQVVTLASIVEREKVLDSEAPAIASVFHNRLKVRMPLQDNSSVIYALESVERDIGDTYWGRRLTPASLRFKSPYNTYRRTGLPPGPISSPSRETMLAVLYPAHFDNLFFVSRGGGDSHYFERTYQAHLRNIVRYRARSEPQPSSGTELQRIVDGVMSSLPAHTGIVVKNLATGEFASLNADEYFTAASLYKLAVLWQAYEERERGRLSFDERIAIEPAAAGSDVPEVRRRLGTRPTVGRALREMIVVSSNAAGVTFLRRFGRARIERLLRQHGLANTSLSSMRLLTTPQDVARLLELLATGRAVSPRASAEMLSILEHQRIRDRLPRYLPKGVRIAHKTGEIDYPSHDAGIVYTRSGPVAIVAMTETPKNPAHATEAIAELGRIVYDYFERYRPASEREASVTRAACPESPFLPRRNGPLSGRTIVLDPGHGGLDPGAVFRFLDGFVLQEKKVALDVSVRLKDLLVARGATVHLTRCRDVFLPLMTRPAFANRLEPDAFVSVHLNGSPDRRKDGTELYYFHGSGKVLANYLLGTFSSPALWETLSATQTLPNRGRYRRQFDVLAFALAPAALTESLFMTNPVEARLLRDVRRVPAARRQQIALGQLRGLLNYFVPGSSREGDSEGLPAARVGPSPAAEVRISAVGDISLGATPVLPFGGATDMFTDVSRYLTGDVVLGNLEGALAFGGVSKCAEVSTPGCFAFRVPPWYAHRLEQAGFSVLNLANNHSGDFGPEGTAETIAALDGAGLLHTGRRGQVARVEVGAVRVAVLGFAPYERVQNLLDIAAARALVRRADTWADLVIVNMHAGAEGASRTRVRPGPEVFLGEPRGDPVAFAHAAIEAGADLVVGHGPHVLRGMEWYRGRLIAYSLGNFSAHHTFSVDGLLGLSGVLQARLRADGTWAGGRFVGVRLEPPGRPVAEAGVARRLVRRLSVDDFGKRAVGLTKRGELVPPEPAGLTPEPRGGSQVAGLTALEKARLLVVAGSPFPAGVGGVFVGRWNRASVRPRGSLVFTDQEGGKVKAFPDIAPWSPARSYTDSRRPFAQGRATGRGLHRYGVHVDLAPVLDAKTGPLGRRHFRNPAYALAFARGLAAAGVGSCPKHFPGLGSTPISTDVARARGAVVPGEVAQFRAAIRQGVPCVMVSHAVYPSLGRRPASLEPATYRLLRRSGFRGAVITDDLDVLGRSNAARSARLAVAAGADLLLFTSGEDAGRAIEALVPLARSGLLDAHVARVLHLRRIYGVPPPR